ncbi:MAG: hypothetical protein ACR2GM_13805 [Nocardioidaceae bacterium]
MPDALRGRPFTVAQAMAYGVSVRMLRGSRHRHLLDGVYVCADT